MNVQRGALRLWCVASLLWVAGSAWWLDLDCALGDWSAPWCGLLADFGHYLPSDYWRLAMIVLAPPAAALGLGASAVWVSRGFRPS